MEKIVKYPLDEKYLVAVSGGPDSMALLDLLIKSKYSIIVCFVNYHHRSNSNDEEKMVKAFCKKNNVTCEILNAHYKIDYGNFENWARVVRYDFFAKIGKKYKINQCFVGHHQDDLLETYLLQKQRGYVSYYGLQEQTNIKGIFIIRPLLKYTKNELEEYCKQNKIPYSFDYTNNDVNLSRNKIRLEVLSKYSSKKKLALLKEIEEENKKISIINKKINRILCDTISLTEFNKLNEEEKDRLLYAYIAQFININLSKARLLDIKKQISSLDGNKDISLNEDYSLIKEYSSLKLVKNDMYKYYVVVEKPMIIENKYIYFDLISNPSTFYIKKDSYPLIIRNVEKDRKIKIGSINKSVSRLLIDEKVPYLKRLYWPEIVNNKGEIIFVPRKSQDEKKLYIVKDKISMI